MTTSSSDVSFGLTPKSRIGYVVLGLIHSLALTGKKPKKRQSREERELIRRATREGKANQKDVVRNAVLDSLGAATGLPECVAALRARGFTTYLRGKTPGVIELKTGKKYRLKTLGLEQTFHNVLEVYQELGRRENELRQLRIGLALEREREGREL